MEYHNASQAELRRDVYPGYMTRVGDQGKSVQSALSKQAVNMPHSDTLQPNRAACAAEVKLILR